MSENPEGGIHLLLADDAVSAGHQGRRYLTLCTTLAPPVSDHCLPERDREHVLCPHCVNEATVISRGDSVHHKAGARPSVLLPARVSRWGGVGVQAGRVRARPGASLSRPGPRRAASARKRPAGATRVPPPRWPVHLAAHERVARLNTRVASLEKRLSEALGQQAWRESGLGTPTDIDALNQQITHLEQQVIDLRQQLAERDEDLTAARAANRELMARVNTLNTNR